MKDKFNQSSSAKRRDVYEQVTARIAADLEKGVRPWRQPWKDANDGFARPQRHNSLPYSGINVLMLWSVALERGYLASIWMTFNQAMDLGGHVRKGERGSLVAYANRVNRTELSNTGEEIERAIPFLKAYTVFNVEQIEGLPPSFYDAPLPRYTNPVHRIEHAERFFGATGAKIHERGGKAYYRLDSDAVHIPRIESFPRWQDYYATLAHEIIHWTRHPTRMARDLGKVVWGDAGYAMEELVAELGSAFLCADLEVGSDANGDHSAYIGSWLKILKNDKRAIFAAASHAQCAVEFLHRLQPAHDICCRTRVENEDRLSSAAEAGPDGGHELL